MTAPRPAVRRLYDFLDSGNGYKVRLAAARHWVVHLDPSSSVRGWLERVRGQPGHLPITQREGLGVVPRARRGA